MAITAVVQHRFESDSDLDCIYGKLNLYTKSHDSALPYTLLWTAFKARPLRPCAVRNL
jgi:hypothetical protein